jgi:hypothetical protein
MNLGAMNLNYLGVKSMAEDKKQQNENQKTVPLTQDWNRGNNGNFVADNTRPPPRQPDKDDKDERRR